MLFNSLQFVYFLPVVLILYFMTPDRFRWVVLLVASYYFYMSWNVNYVFLILFTTIVSYAAAIGIGQSENKDVRKALLIISVSASLGVLFFYKYFNFFGSSLNEVLSIISIDFQVHYLKLLLPVGISFYTFQTLSYTIDVYYGKKSVEKHFGIYALYVSFFPQLVAGPIERSTRLLPQFRQEHRFSWDNIVQGGKWIISGFFMKLVVADRVSLYVDSVYGNVLHHSGITFIVATTLFAFQIYCDFAGYSAIAIGVARLMGYDLMINFWRPYFATSIGDFWHRWHISLSTWFRDYFYIPLGGSRVKVSRWYLNLFLTFLVSGLWHGANWTFVIWGALHGIYIILENYFKLYVKKDETISTLNRLIRVFIVFVLATFAWIFFRADHISHAFYVIQNLFDFSSFYIDYSTFFYAIIGLSVLFIFDFVNENYPDFGLLDNRINLKIVFIYLFLLTITLSIGVFNGGQFIYFQF